jgi:SAM-dependent methyltransferase
VKQLDLGCGGAYRIRDEYEGYGVDLNSEKGLDYKQVKHADLAIAPIPYEDNMFDLVTAYDFLEHIPAVLYLWNGTKNVKRAPMVELMNEIYRVLKPDGEFYMQTPAYMPNTNIDQLWGDPTHCFVWTPTTVAHFSGDYFGQHADYGHTSDFTMVNQEFENGHICLTLKASKPAREGAYLL